MTAVLHEVATAAASPTRPVGAPLHRADGIELVGEYKDSGFRQPPKLAQRADGQMIQLTDLLYAVAAAADGRRDAKAVADLVSRQFGRTVTAENVRYLVERKLRPLGVLALPDGTTPELEKREPLMALRHRRPLLSERAVNAGARLFTWLHFPLVKLLVLFELAVFDVWLFAIHGIAGGLRSAIYDAALLLAVIGSVVVATAFHEFGHASACRYGGGRPGVMGIGLYVVWPAFYCDVTDAYRLDRMGRLRTDLGGVYFNAIFALLAGGLYFVTGEEAALLAAAVQHIIVLQQLLPLLRFDGYYVLTDLTGVPDILSRIKPIFRSLVRGRRREPRVAELKPWVRFAVTSYLLILIPTLAFFLIWMTLGLPRLAGTVHDSFGLQVDRIRDAADPAEITLGSLRVAVLVLPVVATVLSLSRVSRMIGRGLLKWSGRSRGRRVVAGAGAAALVATLGYIWWPNGDYEPIRPGERGTVGEALSSFPHVVGGRPSFPPENALIYEQAPTEREAEALREGRHVGPQPAARENEQAPGFPYDGKFPEVPNESGDGLYSFGTPAPLPPTGTGTATPPATTTTSPATEPAPPTTATSPTTTETAPTTTSPPTTTDSSPTTTESTPTTTEPPATTTETTPPTTETTTTPDPLTTTAPETTTPTTPETTTTSPTP